MKCAPEGVPTSQVDLAQFEHVHVTIPLSQEQVVTSPPPRARRCSVRRLPLGAWRLRFMSMWDALVDHLLFRSVSKW